MKSYGNTCHSLLDVDNLVTRASSDGSCSDAEQGESRITSHLHHTYITLPSHYFTVATSGIAYRQTSDQAQAMPGWQYKGVRHILKQKKKEGIKCVSRP